MTQLEAIKIWLDGAIDSMDTAQQLLNSRKFNHSLFFLHLAVEKILKAVFIHKKDTAPPYTHDLVVLAEKSGIKLTKDQKSQLAEISEFNVSARYEEYKYKIYKKATEEYTKEWFKIGTDLFDMFKKEL